MKNRVKHFRDEQDISQTDLANNLEVSRQTIHSIETGKFIPSTLLALKIARYFSIEVEKVFMLEEED
jgi:putative transcriptional regulator